MVLTSRFFMFISLQIISCYTAKTTTNTSPRLFPPNRKGRAKSQPNRSCAIAQTSCHRKSSIPTEFWRLSNITCKFTVMKMNIFVLICVIFLSITNVYTHNKYSKEANAKNDELPSLRTLEKPYRMAKLNMLWTKAQLVKHSSFFCITQTKYLTF